MLATIVNNIEKLQKFEGKYTITRDSFQFTLPKTEELFDTNGMRLEQYTELDNVVDALYFKYKNDISEKFRAIYNIQLNDSLGRAYLVNSRKHLNTKDLVSEFDEVIIKEEDLKNKIKGEDGLNYLNDLTETRNDLLDMFDSLEETLKFCEKIEAYILKIIQKIKVEALTYGKGSSS